MPDDDEANRLIDELRRDLRENRELMELVHEDLQREREAPPPWARSLTRRVENLERDVYGNGRDGLKEVVTRLDERGKRGVRMEDSDERRGVWLTWGFLAAVVTAGATLAVGILQLIGRLYGEG